VVGHPGAKWVVLGALGGGLALALLGLIRASAGVLTGAAGGGGGGLDGVSADLAAA
jgi:hypothetical protein